MSVVAVSAGEDELAGLDTALLVGHLAVWNNFMSVDDAATRHSSRDGTA